MSEIEKIKKDIELKQKWLKEIKNLEDVINYTERARCYVGYEKHEYNLEKHEYNLEKHEYNLRDIGSKTYINDELKNSIHELAKEKLNQLTEDGYEKWLEQKEQTNES